MDIHSTIRQRTSLEQAPLDYGPLLCFAGNAKEDESKATNLFLSFEKNVNWCVMRRKQEEQKAKKNETSCRSNRSRFLNIQME